MRLVPKVEAYNARGNQLLERPTSSKPAASPKLFFLNRYAGYSVGRWLSAEHIRQKNIASSRLLVLAKHRVNCMLKLGGICLVNTTRIYLKVP
jgi:hypothetical protein